MPCDSGPRVPRPNLRLTRCSMGPNMTAARPAAPDRCREVVDLSCPQGQRGGAHKTAYQAVSRGRRSSTVMPATRRSRTRVRYVRDPRVGRRRRRSEADGCGTNSRSGGVAAMRLGRRNGQDSSRAAGGCLASAIIIVVAALHCRSHRADGGRRWRAPLGLSTVLLSSAFGVIIGRCIRCGSQRHRSAARRLAAAPRRRRRMR